MISKPENPFRPETVIWSVMEYDWSEKTTHQIAKELFSTYYTIRDALTQIRKKTGYRVPHAKGKPGRKAKD